MKHAYLIIAHNEFGILEKLITMLDYDNNDLYIHIDKKVPNFDFARFSALVKHAHIEFTSRVKVAWGDVSIVKATLLLMEAATKTHHDYYHLLSGVDLPVASHDAIEAFFQENNGKEFIDYDVVACETGNHLERLKYHYVRLSFLPNRFATKIYTTILNQEKKRHVDRLKGGPIPANEIMKGSQWCDFTHDFAVFALAEMQKPEYRKLFQYTHCLDEMFLHTILYRSPFYKNCTNSARYIDWSTGGKSPATITGDYWDEMTNGEYLFARKFSEAVDADIVQKVFEAYR